jgi:signal transduction histidine kinase
MAEQKAQELGRAYNELKALDRAKTEFLSVISHELRTPINLITGYAGMLSERAMGILNSNQADAVNRILDGGTRLTALVNDLIDIARLEAGALALRLEELDYLALVRDVLYAAQIQAEQQGIKIELHLPDELPPVRGDPHRTAQVLENLVSNAIKFSETNTLICVGVRVEGTDIFTEIQDSGPGIPEEALPKLFTRFYQVDMSATRAHGGTGLGLAIVKGLVESMGGKVGVLSRAGHGSMFWFTLPIANQRIEARTV